MAEENAAPKNNEASGGGSSGAPQQKPTLFIILAIVNMLVVAGVGAMIYMGQQKKAAEAGIDDVVQGEAQHQKEEAESKDFIGKLVPLESFLVNLSGSRGRKLAKINMELEVSNVEVQEEIQQLKPEITNL